MIHKPTPEQERIFTFIKKRPENLLIKARAGTGKTHCLIEALNYIPKDKRILFLAFNNHIKKELTQKLPSHVKCMTTYGLGLSAIKRKYGESIVFDEFKIDKIIQSKAKSWKLDEEFDSEEEISIYFNSIKKLVNLCRLTLTLKPEYVPYIIERYDINLTKPKDIKRVFKVLDEATNDRKLYDYTDMIYLPAVDNSLWLYPYDYVILDEVQDVGRCQIRLVEKSLKRDKLSGTYKGRLIAVGDDKQNIYSFIGSDEKSFEWFEKFPNTKILPLTVSFRCAKNIIIKAQEIVPDIKALDNAPDGIVRDGNVLEEAQSGDFVLCRTTMPLVRLFFEFLTQHKKAVIKGSDIGVHLIELIGKINNIDKLRLFWEKELDSFKKDLKANGVLNPIEHSGYSALEDKVTTLLFLSKLSTSIEDLKLKIRTIFTDEIEGIVLSTTHRIKGLESDRVFIIRPDLMPLPNSRSWQYAQEKNIEYISITRAKLELIYDRNWSDEK